MVVQNNRQKTVLLTKRAQIARDHIKVEPQWLQNLYNQILNFNDHELGTGKTMGNLGVAS